MIGTRVKVADGDGLQRPGEEGDVGKEKDGGRAQRGIEIVWEGA
jgi:hypothetical protein